GGPLIDKWAAEGDPSRFEFPEPQVSEFDFSFSGLKTAILYFIRDHLQKDPDFLKENMADICASVQNRIVGILLNKLERAAEQWNINQIAIAGGVSANTLLRSELEKRG